MKRKILTILFALLMLVCLLPTAALAAAEPTLTDLYVYTPIDDAGTEVSEASATGYKVGLTEAFKAQVNKATSGTFTSGSYTWTTGAPLPNPAPNGEHNGKPVTNMSYMFSECSALTSLNVSSWDTSMPPSSPPMPSAIRPSAIPAAVAAPSALTP